MISKQLKNCPWLSTMLSALFNGRPDKNLVDTGGFQHSDEHLEEFLGQLPSLSEESKTKVVKELTYDELEDIIKHLPNGKSPGLDGVPYELYKCMWGVIGKEFHQVIKDQMSSFRLNESGKHGATVVPPKVEGIPDVTELRPLTLLCCDYSIMCFMADACYTLRSTKVLQTCAIICVLFL